MFSDDLPWTDTSYDRDFDEEAAQRAEMMENPDPNELDTTEEPANEPAPDNAHPHDDVCHGCGGPYRCVCDDLYEECTVCHDEGCYACEGDD
jgi:hypothetical protein